MTSWHRWLGASSDRRVWGKSIADSSNLLFVLIIVTGPFLWLPREWSAAGVRAIVLFRGGLTGRARDWNWHHVAGIWTALPLIILALTGVIIAYPWAGDLLYRLTGTQAPPRQGRSGGERREGGGRSEQPSDWTGLEAALTRAKQQVPGWKTITVRLTPASPQFAFTIDRGTGGEPQKRGRATKERPAHGRPAYS